MSQRGAHSPLFLPLLLFLILLLRQLLNPLVNCPVLAGVRGLLKEKDR